MKYDHYHNCLRLSVINDDMQDERIDALVTHCKEYGFDNVMLMLNQEEFNLGHITPDEARNWLRFIQEVRDFSVLPLKVLFP